MPSKKQNPKKNDELQTTEELQRRQVDALAQLGEYAVEGRPLGEVVKCGMQMIYEILDADYCLLLKVNRNKNELEIEEAIGVNAESAEDLDIHIDEKWQEVNSLDRMESTIINDFSKEERFSPAPIFNDKAMTSGINVVVRGYKQAYGMLGMYSEKKRIYSDHDKSFLMIVANIIGEIIERNSSERKLKALNEELQNQYDRGRKLQQEVLQSNVAERWELGSFLHDTVGQKLVAVKMMADSLSKKHSDGGGGQQRKI